MARVPENVDAQQLHVAARRVLLDGLTALSDQLDALTVVGAQAVYLRTPEAALRTSFTSDGDISIDPDRLQNVPLLDQALLEAGFELLRDNQPGLWMRTQRIGGQEVPIEFDLLMAKGLAPKVGKRSVKIPPHGVMSARWVPGLEVAAVDRSPMTITSLEAADARTISVNVAGPAALLVAKAFKINDRLKQADARPERLTHKDAGDVLRIIRAIPVAQVTASFAKLREDPRVGEITREGLQLLKDLFGGPTTPGVGMAVQALSGDLPEATVRALAPAYVSRLM
ncbi:hypothetical protein [Streptomyces sp. NBC_00887]|uniref:hypothetical protein n=1 Tax=Streptomyces sp. NBC_00887 TaxID=2975859 RepID=UPI002F90AD80|nr:hypothetical protein OG844_46560 [Streptomyces sp. NBC_00887]